MRRLRQQLASCISVRHTPHDEFRVTLRLTHIAALRPDWTYDQWIKKAESLAAYVSKTDDSEHDWLEVVAIAEDLARLETLSDAS